MKNILLVFMLGLVFISLASASPGIHKQDTNITLLQTCDNCTYVNITTIVLGNKTIVDFNELMTKEDTVYDWELHFNYTSSLGTYVINGIGDDDGVETIWTYTIEVTPSGSETTTGNAIITFLAVFFFFILGVLALLGGKKQSKKPIKWTFMLFGFIFFLAGLNLISVILPDSLVNANVAGFFDSFTAISFIMFWFTGALIIIMWILTFFQTVFYKKTARDLAKYG